MKSNGYIESNFLENFYEGDKKAVLVVHFGTTYDEARTKTLDVMTNEAKNHFPDYHIEEAYSSRIVIKRLGARGIHKNNPLEAMIKLKEEGYTHVLVISTNIIEGIETLALYKQVEMYKENFKEIRVALPLLSTHDNYVELSHILNSEFGDLKSNEALVLVGHGTSHSSNSSYACMDYTAKSLGYNYYVGTIDGFPCESTVSKFMKKDGIEKVILAPFLFVAGDHANNDIAEDWAEVLEKEGFEVTTILKSLGEMKSVRDILFNHAKFLLENQKEDIIAKKIYYSQN